MLERFSCSAIGFGGVGISVLAAASAPASETATVFSTVPSASEVAAPARQPSSEPSSLVAVPNADFHVVAGLGIHSGAIAELGVNVSLLPSFRYRMVEAGLFVQTGGGLGGAYTFVGGAGGVTLAFADGLRASLLGLAGRTRYEGIAVDDGEGPGESARLPWIDIRGDAAKVFGYGGGLLGHLSLGAAGTVGSDLTHKAVENDFGNRTRVGGVSSSFELTLGLVLDPPP